MGRKTGLLGAFIVALGLALPIHSEVTADLASQVRADLTILASEPTLTAWQGSHAAEKVEPAQYETEKYPFEMDFARLHRWCAASVASLPSQALRAALFYVPLAKPLALPTLPVSVDGARIRACRMEAIWYEARADISMDALVNRFSSFWGRPNEETANRDIVGSALWKHVVAWHRKGMNIWTAYDVQAEPGGPTGPRLIVYARRDIPPDEPDLDIGLLGYTVIHQALAIAARTAAQDPALTAAILDRSQCLTLLKHESESLTVSHLAEWLKFSADTSPARRAAAFLVADAYVTCAQVQPSALERLGAEFATHCPQDGPAYDGNFLRQAEKLDPEGPTGELAGLISLGKPCSLEGHRGWPDLVIEKGERLLSEFQADQWTPWIHFTVARAHAAKLSFAYLKG